MSSAPIAPYRSTQSTYLGLFILVPTLVLVGLWVASHDDASTVSFVIWAFVGVLAVLAAVFSRLTVTVDRGAIVAEFAPGWPRRRIALSDVTDVSQVRNRWYQGWGVRKVKGGWMYNVWGLDAVELQLGSGKIFRIGTDDPDQLRAAIEAARAGIG